MRAVVCTRSLQAGWVVTGFRTHSRICSPLSPARGRKEVSQLKDEHKVKRMNLNVEVSLHNAFKAATAAQGENMTDVLLEFIEDYVRKHPAGGKPVKRGRQ